jgi:hypothetical protein
MIPIPVAHEQVVALSRFIPMFWPCSEEILKRDMTRYPGGQVK